MEQSEQEVRDAVNREVWGGEEPVEQEVIETQGEEEVVEQEDPWAGVNPTLRQTLESLQTRLGDLDTINTRLKQAESRIGGAERRLHEAKVAAQQKIEEKPTAEQVKKASESSQAWDALKEDFPEWAEALESVKADLTGKTAEIEKRIPSAEAIREELQKDFDARLSEAEKKIEIRLVDRAHKGWKKTIASPDYQQWFATLPQEEQAKANSWSADDAIDLLDQFEEHRKKNPSPQDVAAKRKSRLEAAVDTRSSTKPTKTKSEDEMTPEELRRYIFAQEFKE